MKKILFRMLALGALLAAPAAASAAAVANSTTSANLTATAWSPPPEQVVLMPADQIEAFRAYAEGARKDAGAPGLALAIVQPGKVLLLDGWGVREAGTTAPVTPDTRFALGPATQALNSLLVARLADEGKLDLDAPARRCWSDFRLTDPDATKVVSLRNLLEMTAGVPDYVDQRVRPPHDAPADLFATLAQLPILAQPGEEFHYSGASASAAGYLAAMKVANLRDADSSLPVVYADLAQTELFAPLGMKRASFAPVAGDDTADEAVGHLPGPGGVWVPVPPAPGDAALLPAEGLYASARDVAAWLQLELTGGVAPDGTRLLSQNSVRLRWKPESSRDARQYGMGWERTYYRGLELVARRVEQNHQAALLVIVPQYRTAAVALVNISGKDANDLLQDVMLNLADWLRETALLDSRAQAPAASGTGTKE
jgi:CubicO group peptidase (beta-lactamase class C family)